MYDKIVVQNVREIWLARLLLAGLLVLCYGFSTPGQQPTRLYLKDGTYQLVRSYEVRGDRVHFYSVERSEWEDVPLSLVDLQATRRGKAQEAAETEKAIGRAQELEKEHFERPPDSGPQIAPGVRLPAEEGIYSYDGLRLIRLIQSSGEIVTDKKRLALSLAIPGPLFKNRQLVVLAGPKAAVRMPNSRPSFFAQFADGLGERLQLVSLKSGKQDRVVENIESRFRPSQASESRATLALDYVRAGPGLFKLTPLQALSPGEYAFGELIQGKLNLDLWDFGIDGNTKPSRISQPANGQAAPMSEQPPNEVPQARKPKSPLPTQPVPEPGQPQPPR
jgi:hypothetical protein